MFALPKGSANHQTVISQVLIELVDNREVRAEVQETISRFLKANADENKRISEADIRRMLLNSILKARPHLSNVEASRMLERRLEAAYAPYKATEVNKPKSMTAFEAARAARRATVRANKSHRR